MTVRVLTGDVRERLLSLPGDSVQCCVTSPPYFGLRDYGTAQWDGGDSACDHKPIVQPRHERPNPGGSRIGNGGTYNDQQDAGAKAFRDTCGKCGAVRIDAQIGLEPTLAEYVETMVAVFRDVRRVLRPDGTVWLNLGDSYASSGGVHTSGSYDDGVGRHMNGVARYSGDLKPKDLMMVPARVALALQDDGWWLRSDIIWAKRNCMPESVTDRPTSSHEHIFLLTKSKTYYYDADAVKEDAIYSGITGMDGSGFKDPQSFNGKHRRSMLFGAHKPTSGIDSGRRNQRNVWHLATEPYPDSHFAVFPTEIPRRCIKAGTSERGACAACGAPWVRQSDSHIEYSHIEYSQRIHNGTKYGGVGQFGNMAANRHRDGHIPGRKVSETTGWQPGCTCDADVVPCVVLDPFLGSGTTLLVADQLGRDGVGIELNPEYARMAENRIRNDAPMFAEVVSG